MLIEFAFIVTNFIEHACVRILHFDSRAAPMLYFYDVFSVNDATRYAQLLQERRKTAMTHTKFCGRRVRGEVL